MIGKAAAGHPFEAEVKRGQAIQIFTGALMPEGPDTVMMSEDCEIVGGDEADPRRVSIAPGIKRFANSRRAGEDINQDQIVLKSGQRLRPQDVGMAAAAGHNKLQVNRPLTVALLSNGDELREPGDKNQPGSI